MSDRFCFSNINVVCSHKYHLQDKKPYASCTASVHSRCIYSTIRAFEQQKQLYKNTEHKDELEALGVILILNNGFTD